jgi:hypothetical protein
MHSRRTSQSWFAGKSSVPAISFDSFSTAQTGSTWWSWRSFRTRWAVLSSGRAKALDGYQL